MNNKNIKSRIIRYPYFLILLVVFISFIFIFFTSPPVLLSPEGDDNSMSLDNAMIILNALGDEGIAWYCGERVEYVDNVGNVYKDVELKSLKKVLGNNIDLELEFCN